MQCSGKTKRAGKFETNDYKSLSIDITALLVAESTNLTLVHC